MNKGVSIFYEFHEQGYPHLIAGIYSAREKSEDEMRTELLNLLGSSNFHDRDEPIFVNHTHLYAKHLLGEELDKDVKSLLNKFFPVAVDIEGFQSSSFKFMYYDSEAYNFIWNNRLHKELIEHRNMLLSKAAAEYKEKRKTR